MEATRVSRQAGEILPNTALVMGTMAMALSVYIDAWYHEAIGRESFWILPHLGIYAGYFISLTGFFSIWKFQRYHVSRSLWAYFAGMIGVGVSGYADELWHEMFGVEKVGTLAAIWSPTHVAALASGALAAIGIILSLTAVRLSTSKTRALDWLIAAEFAVLVSIVTLIILPLGPETPFRILGIWGASMVAFIILSLRFYGSVLAGKSWSLSLITGFNWTGNAIILTNHASLRLLLLLLVVGVGPPIIGDIIIQRGRETHRLMRSYAQSGIIWGIVFGAMFYPLTNGVLSPPLDNLSLVIIGVTSAIASCIGGTLAGSIAEHKVTEIALIPPVEASVGVPR